MESIQTIFLNSIKENKENPRFIKILEELSFELSKKKIQRLKDDKKRQQRIAELFEQYCKILDNENIKNSANISAIIHGLISAINFDKEEFLYKTIYEIEELKKSSIKQKKDIQNSISGTYNALEKHINSLPKEMREVSLEALNDTKLSALEMLGILSETTQEALLTTLEKQSDIEDTTKQITKNLTFQAINDGAFSKKRIIDIAGTILESSLELANENLAFSKELVQGSVQGTKEGILKSIDKFKNDIKFAPDDDEILVENLELVKNELPHIEDDYIEMLKQHSQKYDGRAKQILDEIIERYDSSVEKVKRATTEAKEVISQRIEELKTGVNIDELKEKAEEKLENLKKDVAQISKKANETIENIKTNETAKRATTEAKKLGLRAWEVAKNMLKKD